MNFLSLFLIACAVALSVVGDFYLKRSGGQLNNFFYLGLALYAFSALPAAFAFQRLQFGIVFIIWEALMIILGLLIGSTYFKESFSVNKAIALALCLMAIFFAYR